MGRGSYSGVLTRKIKELYTEDTKVFAKSI
jgi:hypothetical protein